MNAPPADWIHAPKDMQNRAGKTRTFPTGAYVNPLHMQAEDIHLADIAHALSLETRYAGHCPFHYSVGYHSILVSREIMTGNLTPTFKRDLGAAGLLHDAAEAFLKDIPSPVKHDPRFAFYREAEARLERMIFQKFDLNPDLISWVKPADDAIFRREAAQFFGIPAGPLIRAVDPFRVEMAFIELGAQLEIREFGALAESLGLTDNFGEIL